MTRRSLPILIVLSLVILSLLVSTPFQALALTPTRTPTKTVGASPTRTNTTCPAVIGYVRLNSTTGPGIANVRVTGVIGTRSISGTTNSSGFFVLGGCGSAGMVVTPTLSGYLFTPASQVINGSQLIFVGTSGTPTPTATIPAGPLPDLTVLSITEYSYSVPTATPNAQGCWWQPGPTVFTATNVTIQNIGAADAGSFVVDMNGARATVSGLAAGQTLTVNVGSTQARTRTATVDITGLVAESNENNNVYTLTLSAASATPTGTARPTQCLTPTPTQTIGASHTPTPTTQAFGTACSPVNSTIAAPFTFDGVGSYCWKTKTLGYINSWNATKVTLNGFDITNRFIPAFYIPPMPDGYWYIGFIGNFAWSHFETK